MLGRLCIVGLILCLAGCGGAAVTPPPVLAPITPPVPSPTVRPATPLLAPSVSPALTMALSPTPAAPVPSPTVPQATLAPPPSASPSPGPHPTPSSAVATPTVTLRGGVPAFSHVFIIVLENKEASEIVSNQAAAYLNQLAAQYGRAANYYGITHPSLPNYLALTGGDTFGIASDCTSCSVAGNNIAAQLARAGRSWKAYMESMPQPCFTGAIAGEYAKRHDPFMYYDNIRNDPAQCGNVVPLSQLEADLQAGTVPDFAWISPNVCSDMHDCAISTGDAWLQTWVPKIVASPAWKDNGVLFITFDEGKSGAGCCRYAAGGQVDTVVISPLVRSGFVSQVAYDHYSLLRTVEQAWGLPLLGKAACDCTSAMSDFFAAP